MPASRSTSATRAAVPASGAANTTAACAAPAIGATISAEQVAADEHVVRVGAADGDPGNRCHEVLDVDQARR